MNNYNLKYGEVCILLLHFVVIFQNNVQLQSDDDIMSNATTICITINYHLEIARNKNVRVTFL